MFVKAFRDAVMRYDIGHFAGHCFKRFNRISHRDPVLDELKHLDIIFPVTKRIRIFPFDL